ncbi:integrating conjugative element protein [Delftia lacustris]|nr:integrating conjugative element protein [Delftia lacustris]
MNTVYAALVIAMSIAANTNVLASQPLIVIEDRGGASALPYYESLDVAQPDAPGRQQEQVRASIAGPATDAETLPVRTSEMAPGSVRPRRLAMPGLQPFFVIGDDAASRSWLRRRGRTLRERGAVGLVVNVETAEGLNQLRALGPGLTLVPVAGSDLALRLQLRHYPALITESGIEQ